MPQFVVEVLKRSRISLYVVRKVLAHKNTIIQAAVLHLVNWCLDQECV